MTTPPPTPSYAQFGQVLAFAERTLTESLRRHLAEREVTPPTWYALKLIGQQPGLSCAALVSDLEGSRELTPDSVRELLERLETEGLIHGDTEVELTDEGEAFYRDLREYVTHPTIRLLSQFDPADIDTTVRTVVSITERVAEELR